MQILDQTHYWIFEFSGMLVGLISNESSWVKIQ